MDGVQQRGRAIDPERGWKEVAVMNADNHNVDCGVDRDGAPHDEQTQNLKLPYERPKLTYHGDLRSLTLFGSFDSKDSGLGSDLVTP